MEERKRIIRAESNFCSREAKKRGVSVCTACSKLDGDQEGKIFLLNFSHIIYASSDIRPGNSFEAGKRVFGHLLHI